MDLPCQLPSPLLASDVHGLVKLDVVAVLDGLLQLAPLVFGKGGQGRRAIEQLQEPGLGLGKFAPASARTAAMLSGAGVALARCRPSKLARFAKQRPGR